MSTSACLLRILVRKKLAKGSSTRRFSYNTCEEKRKKRGHLFLFCQNQNHQGPAKLSFNMIWSSVRVPCDLHFYNIQVLNVKNMVDTLQLWDSTVAQWFALLPHSKKVLGSSPDLSVWSWHVLPVFAWVSSGYSGFLPHQKTCILYSCHCPVTKALALELELVPGRCTVAAHCSWLV